MMRKKRLIMMVIAAICCALFLLVVGLVMMKHDKEEYAKWQAQYKGVWLSDDGDYQLTVLRVTSGHIVLTFLNRENGSTLEYAAGVATAEGEYTVQYGMGGSLTDGMNEEGTYARRYGFGNAAKGTIVLGEKEIFVTMENFNHRISSELAYKGRLRKREKLSERNNFDIQSYMGKKKPDSYEEGWTRYGLEFADGKVSRVHIVWDKKTKYQKRVEFTLAGMYDICFVGDLEAAFGEPTAEKKMKDNYHQYCYERDGYRYEFVTNGYGLIVEGDCQFINPLKGKRVGDFVVDGDTVLRYLGDYGTNRVITLPKEVKKIATGAFTVGEAMLLEERVYVSKIVIPKGIQIEKEAFRQCGKLEIVLENGWEIVPEGAFAYMSEPDKKCTWVSVKLPESVRRLEKGAFKTEMSSFEYDGYAVEEWTVSGTVNVQLNDSLKYIEDDALYGIEIESIPRNLVEWGTNICCCDEEAGLEIPKTVTKIARSELFKPNREIEINGDLPELYGALNYDRTDESQYDYSVIHVKKEDCDELYKQLVRGQRLSKKEKIKVKNAINNDIYFDDDYGYEDEDEYYEDEYYEDEYYEDEYYEEDDDYFC